MPGEESKYSLLISIFLIVVFLALALIGSYFIYYMPRGVPGGENYPLMYGHGSRFYFDGAAWENMTEPRYAQNGSLSGTYSFDAMGDVQVDDSCLILAMVDYNLTPVYYNGSLNTGHLISYRTPASLNVSFRLAGLQEGFHDLAFFSVLDPYARATRTAGFDGWWDSATAMRYNVIEGNVTKPEIRYSAGPLEEYVAYKNRTSNNVLGFGPWLTREPFAEKITASGSPSGKDITSMDVSPGKEINYFINVKNGLGDTNERYGRFVITQMIDYRQVPLRLDVPEYQYYGALGPDRLMALEASIKAPETPGTHILSIVSAPYPYATIYETRMFLSADMTTVILNVKE